MAHCSDHAASFTNVLSGDNVIFRNFAYVQATPRNRRSFIRHVRDTFQRFDANERKHGSACLARTT